MKYGFIYSVLVMGLTFAGNPSLIAQYTSADESDPEATRILQQVKDKFEQAGTYSIGFIMDIIYPGENEISQKGTLTQKGNFYHLDLEDYLIISNDEKRWVYMKSDNLANLYNAKSEDAWMTPQDFLNISESDQFVYALVPMGAKDEYWIEFKPLDSNSEYAKVRMQVKKENLEIQSIKAFARDGSSYLLKLDQINFNIQVQDSLFEFRTHEYPGVKIEDLRID